MTAFANPAQFLGEFEPNNGAHDEVVDTDGTIRPHWQKIVEKLDTLGTPELLQRQGATVAALDNDGVTYHTADDETLTRRRWQLDALPTIIPAEEWSHLEQGVVQRSELLNLILGDLYGNRQLLANNVLPTGMILSDPMFLRANNGIRLPGNKQLFLASSDMVRGADGAWTVLSDKTQVPSGAGYAMENRSVISQLFPRVYRSSDVTRIQPFFEKLRASLAHVAPAGIEDPRAVVLSPGVRSETAFEHAFLAAELGIPLVEGSDLTMRDGSIWMRSISGPKPVHIILRRVDGWYCDPLELRGDSQLGVTGLMQACRQGTVSVVNPIGSGVCENTGLNAYLPMLSQRLLGEDLKLRGAQSWWCGDAASRSHVLANLTNMVLRPTSRLLEQNTVFGSTLSVAQADQMRARIAAKPHLWVGQELVEPATSPTFIGGQPSRSRSVLRTFAVADQDSYYVMPGGLTRVAREHETLHVTNRSGAAAKDTWVISSDSSSPDDVVDLDLGGAISRVVSAGANLSSRAAENFFWLGRYAERAEATARLLRSVNRRYVDFQDSRPGPGPESLAVLLKAITHMTATYPGYFANEAALEQPFDEMFALTTDPLREGSVRHSIDRLLAGSEVVREQMSLDNWLVAGSLQQHLINFGQTAPQDREETLQRSLGTTLSELLAVAGIGAESLARDPSWCYLDIGRRVERATQTLRLLKATLSDIVGQQTEKLVLLTVLSASESGITYRRRYQSRSVASATLRLLVFAEDNPRSVMFQVRRLAEDLDLLEKLTPEDKARTMTLAAYSSVRQMIIDADVEQLTEGSESSHRRVQLAHFTSEMLAALADFSSALSTEDFPQLAPQQPITIPNIL